MASNIKDTGISIQTSIKTTKIGNNSPTTSSFTSAAERRLKIGVSIPGFHDRVARGDLLPHTSYYKTEWDGKFTGGHYDSTNTLTGSKTTVTNWHVAMAVPYRIDDYPNKDCNCAGPPPNGVPDYYVQAAAAEIYNSGFDLLTASVEGKKTIKQFKGVTKRIVDLTRWVTREKAASAWLEGRYAWRTLKYDIEDLHEVLTEFDHKRTIYTERQGGSISDSTTGVIASASGSDFSIELERTASYNWSLRGAVGGMFRPNPFQLNPVKTAWELTKLSFVVDWVYGVGVALDAMAFRSFAEAYTASKGWQCDASVTYQVTGTPLANRSGSCASNWEYTAVTKSRTPTSIPTLPRLTGRALTWDLSLDLQALATARRKVK